MVHCAYGNLLATRCGLQEPHVDSELTLLVQTDMCCEYEIHAGI